MCHPVGTPTGQPGCVSVGCEPGHSEQALLHPNDPWNAPNPLKTCGAGLPFSTFKWVAGPAADVSALQYTTDGHVSRNRPFPGMRWAAAVAGLHGGGGVVWCGGSRISRTPLLVPVLSQFVNVVGNPLKWIDPPLPLSLSLSPPLPPFFLDGLFLERSDHRHRRAGVR